MINWIAASVALILVVATMRFLLKGKINLRLQYALWAVVLVRLLFPFSIGETAISIEAGLDRLQEIKAIQTFSEHMQNHMANMIRKWRTY